LGFDCRLVLRAYGLRLTATVYGDWKKALIKVVWRRIGR
jgi:hypothetical protein